jgi:hypothetical protein
VPQSFLETGQDRLLVIRLDIDDPVGRQAGLRQGGGEEVLAGDTPEDLAAGPRRDSGGEQRRGGAIDRAVAAASDLMQRAQRQTFSRRAASEMARRVERICIQVLGRNASVMSDALSWAGTFHGIGARLLREYAEQIGLNPDFTIHDREDSADLINLVRHQLGYSKTEKRFPTKSTCLGIYSRAVNSAAPLGDVLQRHFPWCAGWEDELGKLFAGYVEAKQKQGVVDYDDLLLYWAHMVAEPSLAEDIGSGGSTIS